MSSGVTSKLEISGDSREAWVTRWSIRGERPASLFRGSLHADEIASLWSKLDDLNWHTLSPNCERETAEEAALSIERGGVEVEASHARARPAGTRSLCGLDRGLDRQLDRQGCDLSPPVARLSEALDAVQLAAKNTAEVIWSTQVSPEWHPAEVPPDTTEAQFAYAGGSGLKLT